MNVVLSPPEATEKNPPQELFLRRFSVAEYHRMAEAGILTHADRVELLDGWVVKKMTQYPPHSYTISNLMDLLRTAISNPAWSLRSQLPITLDESEPEPDLLVAIGPTGRYKDHHPTPSEIALVIEVSEDSLRTDRKTKYAIYAGASLPEYWIVNLVDRVVEIFTDPNPEAKKYQSHREATITDSVPLTLQGKLIAEIPVRDILP